MGNTSWSALRDLLAGRYDEFRLRLTRRLGSEELAHESLNETWLRLNRQDELGPLRSPVGYLLRMAVNIATDHRRLEARLARRSDVRAALDIADPAPDPSREVEARQQSEALQRAIAMLPERTREILIAARVQGLPQQQIADRFGITPRMVRIELRRALDHCEARLDEKTTNRLPCEPSRASLDERRSAAATLRSQMDDPG